MSYCNISTEGTIAARLTHPVFDVFDENRVGIFHSGFCMPPQKFLQSIQCKGIRQGHPSALFLPSIIIQCLMVPSISGQVLGAEKSLQTRICRFLIFIAYRLLRFLIFIAYCLLLFIPHPNHCAGALTDFSMHCPCSLSTVHLQAMEKKYCLLIPQKESLSLCF